MKPQKSPADLADLRRRTTNNKTTLTTNCLSLRDNAACCIPLRDLRYLRENIHPNLLNLYCSNETPVSPADLADLRRQTTKHQNNKTSNHNNHTNPRARAHRLFQKYQCRSVYTLTIRMLHPKSSLFKCHHGVICRNIISASLSPCQLELVSSQNMAYTHDVAVVDADVAILILHPLHNLRCRESQ